ncbi:MAG: alkaline phosphatase family protein [Candidatus Alcyoniella australis]|nr:alkaline phosphatase family protein [Candidatus Alcyoniella australis]
MSRLQAVNGYSSTPRRTTAATAVFLLGCAWLLGGCSDQALQVGLDNPDPIVNGLEPGWRPFDHQLLPARRVPAVEPRPLTHAPDSNELVILGLDGADWRILEPLIAAGLLPNLERLLAGGAAGVLKTDYAYSPTSWTTIATGRVPVVHGVTPDKQMSWFAINVEPREIKVRRIWEMARDYGRTIAVYDFFFCRVRPAGDWGWIPHVPTWEPNELPEGLNLQGCATSADNKELEHLFLKACLLGKRHTDLTLILSIETDAAGHQGMLGWMRRWHPELFAPDDSVPSPQGDDPLTATWTKADAALGEIWRNRPPGSHLLICSDHGFGEPEASYYQALLGPGTLEALGLDRRVLEDGGDLFSHDTPYGKLEFAQRWELGSAPVARFVDREQAEKAWIGLEMLVLRAPIWRGAGWIDQLGSALRDELGEQFELLELRRLDRRTVLVTPRVDQMQQFLVHRQRPEQSNAVIASFLSGTHHSGDDGVVLLVGPKVRPGARIEGAELVDIAPTALYLLGMPVADDLDGRVLTEAFDPRKLAQSPIRRVETYETTPVQRDPLSIEGGRVGDQDVNPALVQRLKSLGYLQ